MSLRAEVVEAEVVARDEKDVRPVMSQRSSQ